MPPEIRAGYIPNSMEIRSEIFTSAKNEKLHNQKDKKKIETSKRGEQTVIVVQVQSQINNPIRTSTCCILALKICFPVE